ncbi:uncharacterized protein [Pyrus communis]|uniref:uncharacterized protein n=1 Tax=Pyrus communis TaxID=23211 RepID=UPI0035BFF401
MVQNHCFAQAAAAAQAGASVIQIFVGRLRDWSRNHSGDPEIEAALKRGEDPGLALVTKAYNYIHKYGHKSKLMAAAVRNKQDLFSLLGVDYIIAPLKVLQALKESVTTPEEKYSFIRRLSPQTAATYKFNEEEGSLRIDFEPVGSMRSIKWRVIFGFGGEGISSPVLCLVILRKLDEEHNTRVFLPAMDGDAQLHVKHMSGQLFKVWGLFP